MPNRDATTRKHIAEHGCTVIHVMASGDLPAFAYSIGITQEVGEPEVCVVGLKRDLAHFVVNEYNRRVRRADCFASGQRYSGFIEGFDVLAEGVPASQYSEYFGQALSFYGGPHFRVLQLIYPTTSGVWPWSPEAPEWFRRSQPLLARLEMS